MLRELAPRPEAESRNLGPNFFTIPVFDERKHFISYVTYT